MVYMKKIFGCRSGWFLLSLFICIIFIVPYAQAAYSLSVDVSYTKNKSTTVGDVLWNEYDIVVSVINNGSDPSENMTIVLDDGDSNISRFLEVSGNAMETVIFSNHPLQAGLDHQLKIHYFPTSLSTKRTLENSGVYEFSIGDNSNEDNNSTPGFVLFVFLLASICFIFGKSKKYLR